MSIDEKFWNRKKVLITGHTGFKGSWLTIILNKLGADVYGYALDPPTNPSLFNEARVGELVSSRIGDIRDYDKLSRFILESKPEIIIHMAAQPLVRESYRNPVETYEVNVMGTVKILEAARHNPGIKAILNVTTDKCYDNKEWFWGYRENEPMGGYDPYSNSKGCSELVTSAYRNSFFNPKDYNKHGVALASARAGNVIGGGDWAEDRLIPDFIRAILRNEEVRIRSPHAIRPWQHVLDPLKGYLMLAERLYSDGPDYAEAWNFGPDDSDNGSVKLVAIKFAKYWGEKFRYSVDSDSQLHEASFLKLDCSKAKTKLGWYPSWDLDKALEATAEWYQSWMNNNDMRKFTEQQINNHFE